MPILPTLNPKPRGDRALGEPAALYRVQGLGLGFVFGVSGSVNWGSELRLPEISGIEFGKRVLGLRSSELKGCTRGFRGLSSCNKLQFRVKGCGSKSEAQDYRALRE